jgi:conjugative transfer pilus assembly protein TraH
MLIFLFLPGVSHADLGNEMNKFWNNLGGSSNGNSAYAGQSVGYYTGGSLNARSPVMRQRPFSAQSPKITAGCGGIDMFTGSFSHINMDQFVAQLKAIGANSVGYAFQLALQTLSPMIKSVVDKIQEVADMINGFNINSCESAKLLVDGIAGKNITLSESGCAQMALISGSAADAAAAKNRCRTASAQAEEDAKRNESERASNINFVWQAMKRAGYIDVLGAETSEVFMSIAGTVILKQNEEAMPIKPLALDLETTKVLIDGGKLKAYECVDKTLCLDLREKEITLDDNLAYKPKILGMLKSMQDKIINIDSGESLTDSELALIGKTSIPLMRILINSATGKSPINIDTMSELVARDTLNKFLMEISSAMRIQMEHFKLVNNNIGVLDVLAKNLDFVTKYLEKDNEKIRVDLQQTLNIIKANERFDRQLASQFSGHIKSVLDFSNSLKIGGK